MKTTTAMPTDWRYENARLAPSSSIGELPPVSFAFNKFKNKQGDHVIPTSQLRMDHDILDGEFDNINCKEEKKWTSAKKNCSKLLAVTHTQNMKQN